MAKQPAGDNEIVEVNQAIKKTGRGGKYNFPAAIEPEAKEDVQAALGSVIYWMQRGREDPPKELDAIQNRCDEYIMTCYETGQRMTVEKLALALGITRETLWKWEQLNDAKGNSGKMNPVPYIFRAKNYYGMKDQQDITIEPKQAISDVTPEEIVTKYNELPE